MTITRSFFTVFLTMFCLQAAISQEKTIQLPSHYEKEWKQFTEAGKKGIPASQLEILDRIIAGSLKEKDAPEFYRALKKYPSAMGQSMKEAEDKHAIFAKFEAMVHTLEAPFSNILHDFLADQLESGAYAWGLEYYDEDFSIPCIVDGKTVYLSKNAEDRKTITEFHLRKSMENLDLLTKQPSVKYINGLDLRISDSSALQIRPTLADLMADSYISYFTRKEQYKRENFDLKWFDPSENFVTPAAGETLKMYQRLELQHWKKGNLYAYTAYTLARLTFVYNQAEKYEKRNDKFEEALSKLKTRINGHPATLHIVCTDILRKLSLSENIYHWKDNPGARDKRAEYHAMLKNALSQFPSSIYAQEAKSLIENIEAKAISLYFEKPNVIGRGNLMTVSYQNVDHAYLSIYHIDGRKKASQEWIHNPLMTYNLTKVHGQELLLEMNGKFNQHSKDFIIPDLQKSGEYLFLITSEADSADILIKQDKPLDDAKVAFASVWVHTFSVVRKVQPDRLDVIVRDLKSGKPIAGAKVYMSNDNGTSTLFAGQTDKKGELKYTGNTFRSLKVIYKNDSITQYVYDYYQSTTKPDASTHKMITDRRIYRPGQTVHFKVFAYEGNSPDFKPDAGQFIELKMSDYDGTEEVVATGKTNEFGTFAGTFVLPATGLPGERFFFVNYDENIATISVEEYKRPSFELEAKFDKTTYKLGDKVTVSGKVKAYSGYGISNAKVSVSITSSPGYRYYFEAGQETVLDTVIQANANGEFSVSFIAKARSGRFGAQFSYDISATSISGETQSTADAIFIGRSPSEWEVHFPSQVISTDKTYGTVKVSSGDTKTTQPIELELWKQNPAFKASDLTFEQHEFQGFDASELNRKVGNVGYFPPKNAVPEYVKISGKTIQSGDSILINDLVNNVAGKYQVKLTYRSGIDTLKFEQAFTYIRMDTKKNQHEADLWTAVSSQTYKPGDQVKVIVGSKHKKMDALVEIYRGQLLLRHEWIRIKGRKEIRYTVQKEDLGGVQVSVIAVRNNNFYESNATINVPFDSKELKVKLETVRDILRPGSQEKWVVSVETKDGSPLSAELAVGMTDVSLDQFVSNTWDVQFYEGNYYYPQWQKNWDEPVYFSVYGDWDGRRLGYFGDYMFDFGLDEVRMYDKSTRLESNMAATQSVGLTAPLTASFNSKASANGTYKVETKNAEAPIEKARTNFSETAFFYPQLTANDNRFNFEFTLPDALTRWRMQALASDKLMRLGYTSNEFVAQKELMADPNEPRFFRAGDEFVFAVNLVNLTENEQNVTASLEWFDPYTNIAIPNVLGIMADQKLNIAAKGSQTASWKLNIPKTGLDLIAYRVKVASAQFSDVEEKVIPVLSNRTQVIESVPVTVEGKGDYVFELPKLFRSSSPTQRNEKLVFEYNANPIWSAVMAIPYIQEYPYECAEQLFSKFFANRISQQIIAENPVIEKVLSQPATNDPDKFLSALEKNEDLKAIVLAETPWVLEAKSEAEQKRRIAQLFELNNLAKQEMLNLTKLQQMQNADGGWSWFAGGNSNIYITQHILSGFGHLHSLGLEIPEVIDVQKAMDYLDRYYAAQYKRLSKEQLKNKAGISTLEVQWLYARQMLNADTTAASEYYTACLKNDWLEFSLHIQSMAGVYFLHSGEQEMAQKIFTSIKSKATVRKNLGMYWNENKTSWYWDRNAIETQASLIEFFKKIGADEKTLASMKLWLLNQKRGQYWESTKTTAWACYALLIDAKPVVNISTDTKVSLGSQPVALSNTGYVRQTFSGTEIQPAMGRITVNQAKEEPAFGSLSLVYTEEIEKVTKNAAGMQLQKTVYVVKDGKEILITPTTKLELGDLIRVRLQLSSDRELEFVHVKDLRASGAENVETMSGYRSSGNLYFYNVNRDASTEFFLDRLPKGKHTISYDMRVSGKGVQSTGYAIAECLYAPEFRANTASGMIRVE